MATSRPPGEPPVAELVDRLSEQTARLMRDELKLARAECTEKAKQGGTAAGLFGAGAILAWFVSARCWRR